MSEASAPSGHFGTLPLVIQVDILLKLTASDLAAMESSSTHFRSVIVDGELWKKKADILGLRVVGQMEKELGIMLENREGEKDCMFRIHHVLAFWLEQNEADAKLGENRKEKLETFDETDSDEESKEELQIDGYNDLETDKESDEKLNGKSSRDTKMGDSDCKEEESSQEIIKQNEAENTKEIFKDNDDAHKGTIDGEQKECYEDERSGDDTLEGQDEDDIGDIDNIVDEVVCVDKDIFRFYTHTRVSSRYDAGHEVDCGMVVCVTCVGNLQQMNMNKEFRCPKCYAKTVLEDWKASVQISIDKEVIRKVKLERILAKKTEGKYKIKKILKFMMKEPPFPSMYRDMAIEEGMQEEEENEPSERGDCVVM
eukprot:GFUD01016350.1.p1 GENE.GFUD01016350.1~~GFUD01016350.1.p1  ORF type:complete len:369 (-),score=105.47 GFUD01016350.1:112-1218(-)